MMQLLYETSSGISSRLSTLQVGTILGTMSNKFWHRRPDFKKSSKIGNQTLEESVVKWTLKKKLTWKDN